MFRTFLRNNSTQVKVIMAGTGAFYTYNIFNFVTRFSNIENIPEEEKIHIFRDDVISDYISTRTDILNHEDYKN